MIADQINLHLMWITNHSVFMYNLWLYTTYDYIRLFTTGITGVVNQNCIIVSLIRPKYGEYFFTNSIMPDGHIYYQTVLFN